MCGVLIFSKVFFILFYVLGFVFLCFIVFSWNDEAWLQQDAHRRESGRVWSWWEEWWCLNLNFINDGGAVWSSANMNFPSNLVKNPLFEWI